MTTTIWRRQINQMVGPDRVWDAAQTALVAGITLAGLIDWRCRRPRRRRDTAPVVAGTLMMAAGATVGLQARHDLAACFSMSPTPVDDPRLVEQGLYGLVRQPMYLSVLMMVSGYAFSCRSCVAGGGAIAALAFFALKIRYEERKLHERYPGYQTYAARVRRRIVPFLI